VSHSIALLRCLLALPSAYVGASTPYFGGEARTNRDKARQRKPVVWRATVTSADLYINATNWFKLQSPVRLTFNYEWRSLGALLSDAPTGFGGMFALCNYLSLAFEACEKSSPLIILSKLNSIGIGRSRRTRRMRGRPVSHALFASTNSSRDRSSVNWYLKCR